MKKLLAIFYFVLLLPWAFVAGEGYDDFTDRMTQEFYETPLKGDLLPVDDTEALILNFLKRGKSGVSLLEDIPEVRQILGDRLLLSLGSYFSESVTLDGLILLAIFGVFQEGYTLIEDFSFSLPIQQGKIPAEVSSLNLYIQGDPPFSMDYANIYGSIWFDYSVRNQKAPGCFVSFCAGVFDLSLQCSFHVVDGSTYVTLESFATDLVVFDTTQGSAKVVLETEYSGRTPVGNSGGSSDLSVTYDILDASGGIIHTGTYIAKQDLGFNYFGTLNSFLSTPFIGKTP